MCGRANLMICSVFRIKGLEEKETDSRHIEVKTSVVQSAADVEAKRSTSAQVNGNIASAPSTLDSLEEIEAPFDGHIVPGRGGRTNCFVPVICVADEDNILSLVSSAVYQRLSLGISIPTIGIVLSSETDGGPVTSARVVLGWIADFEREFNLCVNYASPLPPVHLAFAGSRRRDLSVGIFNLQITTDALQCAQFISGLQDQFSVLLECVRHVLQIQSEKFVGDWTTISSIIHCRIHTLICQGHERMG
ncbi:hypothetical protein CPB84DRAFT_1437541 [Gymnopilus junonius]|uniref:Uncharacterized protein n=1 Tax=Gymnopilus junonius TaxID=109634 RepID=A0A9P5TTI2_GYMJU|nr:hypothetical protein CPB84DRAFT_1437541 [Gymnopilus junonius]